MCVYPFITLVSCSVILGVLGPWEFSGEPGHIFFCVWLRCVECRSGTIYLSASPRRVAGLYGFFLLSGSVEVGTV